jgi:lysozyme family protein
MADFDHDIAPFVLGKEGGYSFNPNDAGGETIWGITVGTARANGYAGPMRMMPKTEALRIYQLQYWQRPHFDQVALYSFPIAKELFDTGVNMGVVVAGQFLQVALNAFNRRGRDYADVNPDGRIGPATINALKSFLLLRGKQGEVVLLRALEALQGERYLTLAGSRPQNEEFEFGWFANRIEGKYDV